MLCCSFSFCKNALFKIIFVSQFFDTGNFLKNSSIFLFLILIRLLIFDLYIIMYLVLFFNYGAKPHLYGGFDYGKERITLRRKS